LASASSDKKIKIWSKGNNDKWECVCTIDDGHTKTIRSLTWSPQGNLLASASFDGTCCIWRKEVEDGKLDFTCI
jgi:WD40 repeat protein